MTSCDVLGDEGRKALDACVKVKIIGRPVVREYDRKPALELLQDCYGGSFPQGFSTWSFFDPLTLSDARGGHDVLKMTKKYTIVEIYEGLLRFDEMKYVEKYSEEAPDSKKLNELIDKRRTDIKKEYDEAMRCPESRLQYSRIVAQRRVRDCFAGNFVGDVPLLEDKYNGKYSITDIHEAVVSIEKEQQHLKCPEDGFGYNELKKLICENRANLEKEYEETTGSGYATAHEYSRSKAERRVRDCFLGIVKGDIDIFSAIKVQNKMSYDIFDIKAAVAHFDGKKLIDKYPEPGRGHDEKRRKVDRQRIRIRSEYDAANISPEIDYGSGFIIHDNSIITCKHVIQTFLDNKEKHDIYISNEAIGGQLYCKVAHHDEVTDLALLFCPELNLTQSRISPLRLSDQPLSTGFAVICFGYPISYKGKRALFVDGKVSGQKETLYGFSLAILNCSLYSGNSGGPVLRRINGELKVVGVVKQKHTQEILTPNEIMAFIDNANEVSTEQLARRLHDAFMSSHSPFNFCDALQGHVVAKFVDNFQKKYEVEEQMPALFGGPI